MDCVCGVCGMCTCVCAHVWGLCVCVCVHARTGFFCLLNNSQVIRVRGVAAPILFSFRLPVCNARYIYI